MAEVAPRASEETPPPRRWPTDVLCLACGGISLGWVLVGLHPGLALPAWPAASCGILALALAFPPGRALPRGVGAFLGLWGLVAGLARIGLLWGLARTLGGA